jgi:hypothetical protein
MLIPIQVQVLAAWMTARNRVLETISRARDDERGELTARPIRSLDPISSRVAVCQIESREASTTNQWFSPGSPSRI